MSEKAPSMAATEKAARVCAFYAEVEEADGDSENARELRHVADILEAKAFVGEVVKQVRAQRRGRRRRYTRSICRSCRTGRRSPQA